MKTFHIFKHPQLGFEAAKSGFSWPALFFGGGIWLLVKKMWTHAALWFGIYWLRLTFSAYVPKAIRAKQNPILGYTLMIAYTVFYLLPAFRGNRWRDNKLIRNGYKLFEVIQAKGIDDVGVELEKSMKSPRSA